MAEGLTLNCWWRRGWCDVIAYDYKSITADYVCLSQVDKHPRRDVVTSLHVDDDVPMFAQGTVGRVSRLIELTV